MESLSRFTKIKTKDFAAALVVDEGHLEVGRAVQGVAQGLGLLYTQRRGSNNLQSIQDNFTPPHRGKNSASCPIQKTHLIFAREQVQ
jgi:hypothetical protein